MTFHVSVEKDERGFYLGKCEELPGALTQARTLDELKARLPEVIDSVLREMEERSKTPMMEDGFGRHARGSPSP